MKLQNYKTQTKDGEIHRVRGKYQYRSKSGKTVREYRSIKELVRAESGESNQKPKGQEPQKTEVVAETPEQVEDSGDES